MWLHVYSYGANNNQFVLATKQAAIIETSQRKVVFGNTIYVFGFSFGYNTIFWNTQIKEVTIFMDLIVDIPLSCYAHILFPILVFMFSIVWFILSYFM